MDQNSNEHRIDELKAELKKLTGATEIVLNIRGQEYVLGDPAAFNFDLGDRAVLLSGEEGEIIGRAEYSEGIDTYFIRYTAADGRLVQDWWSEAAIQSADAPEGKEPAAT